MGRLDEIDRRLLDELSADARVPIAELGRRVGLSRTATLERVRRLEQDGVIRGYHADVAQPEAAHIARVGLVLRTRDIAAYVRRLAQLPEVTEIETVSGEFDLFLRIGASTAAGLDAVLDRISRWPQTVRTTTFIVLRRYLG